MVNLKEDFQNPKSYDWRKSPVCISTFPGIIAMDATFIFIYY